ncbi:MAG: RNA polymerase sigma factor [Actinomycetes bacterium]
MVGEDVETLVLAARAGGGWAFAELWTQLSPAVLGYLRGRGVPDAEDVTSETFLAVFARIGSFRGDASGFRSWLFTIAHHKGVDALRRGPGCHERATGDVRDDRIAASAEELALESLGNEQVTRLLATLTGDQAEVLLLRVVGELSLEETAVVVGKPVGAVKQLQRRGLARLRRDIERRSPITSTGRPAIAWLR